jgi:hypothetical protein
VWAFGVLAWELLTLGYVSYAKITDDQRVVEFVTGGGGAVEGGNLRVP